MSPRPHNDIALLAGRFAVIRELSSDDHGSYLLCTDTALDRRVTLRVVDADNDLVARRTVREYRVLSTLKHPAAPRVYDVLEGEGRILVVLEPIDVGLEGITNNRSPDYAIAIAADLLAALEEAHALGVIHRAVSIRALAVKRVGSERGVVKLLGWGRLTGAGPTRRSSDVLPSVLDPDWAPEILLGEPATPATDVYGVATIVYRLVTGRSGATESLDRLADRILQGSWELDAAPVELEPWLRRALALAPEARFANPKEALAALPVSARSSDIRVRPERGLLGEVLAGRFHVVRPLGRGAMGAVYLARDQVLEREVAIKLLHDASSEGGRQLVDEGRRLGRVRSPNLAHVYEVGEHEGARFLVMEYVEGASLEETLEARPEGLSHDLVARAVDGVARALDDVHAAGMVHGDVKPSNVIVGDRVCLLDFGLVRPRAELVGLREGTPAYLSPERIRAEVRDEIAHVSDVYSLGVMAFELLSGRLPFASNDVNELLVAHCNTPAPRVSTFRPDLPASVDGVLARAMAKDPFERFRTGSALARELAKALADPVLEPLSVMVVGSDALERGALTRRLADRLFVRSVHEATPRTAMAALRRRKPDVVLFVDERSIVVELGATIRAEAPDIGLLAMSASAQEELPFATPTVDEACDDQELRRLLRLVARGGARSTAVTEPAMRAVDPTRRTPP